MMTHSPGYVGADILTPGVDHVFATDNRLYMRELGDDDFDAVHAYASDPEVTKYMPWGPNSPEDTRRFLDDCKREQDGQPRRHWTLAIIRTGNVPEDAQLVGVCSILIESPEHLSASIGYVISRPYWGKGYATEAAQGMVKFAFRRLEMHRVWATCRPDNLASAAVLRKAGMKEEGRFRHHVRIRGQWQDSLLFAIINQ